MECKKCKPISVGEPAGMLTKWHGSVELCPQHAMLERAITLLRNFHFLNHGSNFCGKGCDASELLKEYDQLEGK